MFLRKVLKIYSELAQFLPSSVFWVVIVVVFGTFSLASFLFFYDFINQDALGVLRDFIVFFVLFLFLRILHVGSRNIYVLVKALKKFGVYQYPIVRLEDFGIYVEKNISFLVSKLNSLLEESKFVKDTLDLSPVGVIILDEDDLIVFCNNFAKKLFGVNRDYTGNKVTDLIFDKGLIDVIVEGGVGKVVSVDIQGVEKNLEIDVFKVDSRKVVFIRDITNVVNLENTLSLTTSILSHEVNTPLTNIQLAFESLLLSVNVPKELERIISSNLRRLKVVMTNIASLANVLANKSVVFKRTFNLKEMLQEVLENLRENYGDKSLRLRLVYDAPEEIYGDSEKLNLVLTNILDNAFKFSKALGEVEVKVYMRNQEKLCIEVSNEVEKEIPSGELQNIFNKFYRAQNSYTIKGKGLGLYISKLLCDIMEIEIKATSEGRKVVFTVSGI